MKYHFSSHQLFAHGQFSLGIKKYDLQTSDVGVLSLLPRHLCSPPKKTPLCMALRNHEQAICTSPMHYKGLQQIMNISAELLPLGLQHYCHRISRFIRF